MINKKLPLLNLQRQTKRVCQKKQLKEWFGIKAPSWGFKQWQSYLLALAFLCLFCGFNGLYSQKLISVKASEASVPGNVAATFNENASELSQETELSQEAALSAPNLSTDPTLSEADLKSETKLLAWLEQQFAKASLEQSQKIVKIENLPPPELRFLAANKQANTLQLSLLNKSNYNFVDVSIALNYPEKLQLALANGSSGAGAWQVLKELPDFQALPKLERLDFKDVEKAQALPISLGQQSNLSWPKKQIPDQVLALGLPLLAAKQTSTVPVQLQLVSGETVKNVEGFVAAHLPKDQAASGQQRFWLWVALICVCLVLIYVLVFLALHLRLAAKKRAKTPKKAGTTMQPLMPERIANEVVFGEAAQTFEPIDANAQPFNTPTKEQPFNTLTNLEEFAENGVNENLEAPLEPQLQLAQTQEQLQLQPQSQLQSQTQAQPQLEEQSQSQPHLEEQPQAQPQSNFKTQQFGLILLLILSLLFSQTNLFGSFSALKKQPISVLAEQKAASVEQPLLTNLKNTATALTAIATPNATIKETMSLTPNNAKKRAISPNFQQKLKMLIARYSEKHTVKSMPFVYHLDSVIKVNGQELPLQAELSFALEVTLPALEPAKITAILADLSAQLNKVQSEVHP